MYMDCLLEVPSKLILLQRCCMPAQRQCMHAWISPSLQDDQHLRRPSSLETKGGLIYRVQFRLKGFPKYLKRNSLCLRQNSQTRRQMLPQPSAFSTSELHKRDITEPHCDFGSSSAFLFRRHDAHVQVAGKPPFVQYDKQLLGSEKSVKNEIMMLISCSYVLQKQGASQSVAIDLAMRNGRTTNIVVSVAAEFKIGKCGCLFVCFTSNGIEAKAFKNCRGSPLADADKAVGSTATRCTAGCCDEVCWEALRAHANSRIKVTHQLPTNDPICPGTAFALVRR